MQDELTGERSIFLSTAIASRSARRVALTAVIISAVFFVATVPFAKIPLSHVPAFVGVYQSAIVICDLITTVLLFSQFSVVRSQALLILGSGYLFTACIAFCYVLSYPDLFSSTGLLGAGPQSTAWLYFFWHGGFPFFVIGYALRKNKAYPTIRTGRSGGPLHRSGNLAVLASVAVVLTIVCGLTVLATAGENLLPTLMAGTVFSSPWIGIVQGFWILSVLALIVLWRRRPHTVLDVWLMAVMCAWVFDIGLGAVFNAGRYDLGFYAGRFYALVAAGALLVVLVIEYGKHYTQIYQLSLKLQRDISQREKIQLALLESEEQYRMLVYEIQDYAIFMLDQDGQIITWNAGAERIKGYTAKEIIGQNYSLFFSPEDIKRGRPEEVLRLAAASGRHEEQGMRVRKNGSQFLASTTFTALRDSAGGLRGFSEISRDLSETKELGERYRGLLEAAPDAMVVVDQSGNIVLLNLQAEKQFRYSRDELIGQPVKNIIPEGFAERLVADDLRSAEDALAQRIGTGIELIGRRKDNSEFPIELMLSPLANADGILVTAAIRDISVRKAAETHLAQMEGRYRGLLEAAPDAMVVVNQGGNIVLLNLQAEKQFGYSRDELIGQQVKNIIPEGFAERLIADGTRSAADALAQQIGTGIELIARRKDNSEFPIELMLSPLANVDGILVTAAIRDISVRKAAETHLAQMEGRYRGLLEAAPDAMVVVNQAGNIVLLNLQAEKQFGYHRDELIGQQVKNIIPEGFAERLVADDLRSAEDALAQQIGTGIELNGRRKDGSEFPIELMLSPLTNAEGILVTAAIRDISVRKIAEGNLARKVEELSRSNEELGQFAYIASHDLQEPLRMVASYTQLLSRRYKGKLDADADEFIAFAVDGANRMQRLIQDLLIYSRVGTKENNFVDTSSEDALQQALINLRGTIEASGALVTHDVLPSVLADEGQLIQLFQNLVGNAIKYQNPGVPRIHISAAETGRKRCTFSIRDNGLGIDPQYFERIFGMFQRLHKRDEFAGTGIGLAICKKIVERHGGSISVDSTPGEGSTFRFSLADGERK
jgi:PAS domain S-box-containing protein